MKIEDLPVAEQRALRLAQDPIYRKIQIETPEESEQRMLRLAREDSAHDLVRNACIIAAGMLASPTAAGPTALAYSPERAVSEALKIGNRVLEWVKTGE